jgi:MoxR-like ATPase
MVLATQNPVDQEGTWPLPEAQLDRFLMKVQVDYPSKEHEQQVMQLVRAEQQAKYGVAAKTAPAPEAESLRFSQQEIASCWQEISAIHVAPIIETWIVELVNATRQPQHISEQLASYLAYGLSPRGTLALERCARAQAWLAGRDAVRPEDVRFIAPAVMRHRLMLSYQASADGCSADDVITMLLNAVVI